MSWQSDVRASRIQLLARELLPRAKMRNSNELRPALLIAPIALR
jgi:hypothetical protein